MNARPMFVCLLIAGACLFQAGFPLRAGAQAPAPEVEELWLVDAATDTRLVRIDDYQNIDLAFLPAQLSVEAVASAGTGSVRFAIDDVPGALENLEPYALGGDSLGDFVPVPALREPGWIRISATPYGAENGAGPVGQTFTRRFYRLKTDYVVDSVADLSDAQPGDGVCRTVEIRRAQVAMKAILAPGPSPERPNLTPGVDLPIGIRNVCTLRAAIEEANATPGRQTISLDGRNGRTYELTLGELKVTDGLAIYGHQQPTVDAGKRSRVMSIAGPVGEDRLVDLIDLDLANGDATALEPGARGGVISIEQATLQMFGGALRGGQANFGGGLYLQNRGHATLNGVRVSGNQAGHPASFGGGGVTQRGGGIFNLEGNLNVVGSAVVDNVAVRGGGISNFGGLVRIENSSVMDNEARSLGGGLENRHNQGNGELKHGRMHIVFSTVTGNRSATSLADPAESRVGGGLFNVGWAYIASSVLAGNDEAFGGPHPLRSPDCYSPTQYDFKSYRNNVVGVLNGNCLLGDYSSGGAFGIQAGTEATPLVPALAARTDSPLPHRVPMPGSLVDAGGGGGNAIYPCPKTDIRGRPRPAGAGCDIGAVERQ